MNHSETNDGETNHGETNDGETNDGETNDGETNDAAPNPGPAADPDLVEISLSNHRDYRDNAARWLAVEVLLSDEPALADDDLAARLHGLQDRLEAETRQR